MSARERRHRLDPNRIFRLTDAARAGRRTTDPWTFVEYRCETCGNERAATYRQGVELPATRKLYCRPCDIAPNALVR